MFSREEAAEKHKTMKQKIEGYRPRRSEGETPPESPPEVFSIPPSGVSINTTSKTSTISITIFVIHFIPLIV